MLTLAATSRPIETKAARAASRSSAITTTTAVATTSEPTDTTSRTACTLSEKADRVLSAPRSAASLTSRPGTVRTDSA